MTPNWRTLQRTMCICGLAFVGACADDPPPVSVTEFMENPRILEATMVRCAQNRTESKYVADCLNARAAVNRLEAAEERTRRESLEKQSERKRQALRRTQEAAAEARRIAQENRRRREEAEYLGIFDEALENKNDGETVGTTRPTPAPAPAMGTEPQREQPAEMPGPPESETAAPPTDLGAIREELKRRQESPQ